MKKQILTLLLGALVIQGATVQAFSWDWSSFLLGSLGTSAQEHVAKYSSRYFWGGCAVASAALLGYIWYKKSTVKKPVNLPPVQQPVQLQREISPNSAEEIVNLFKLTGDLRQEVVDILTPRLAGFTDSSFAYTLNRTFCCSLENQYSDIAQSYTQTVRNPSQQDEITVTIEDSKITVITKRDNSLSKLPNDSDFDDAFHRVYRDSL